MSTVISRSMCGLVLIVVPALVVLNIMCSVPTVSAQVVSTGTCPPAPPMRYLNVSRYAGKWYEVEKYFFIFEATASCVTVNYFDNFAVEIIMLEGITHQKTINPGTTRFLREEGNAEVVLDLIITQSPIPFNVAYRYKILDTDYTSYTIKWSCTQVGPINYQNMWILGRQKYFTPEVRRKIYYKLSTLGINTAHLKQSNQAMCPW